jgi:hypothetical protein
MNRRSFLNQFVLGAAGLFVPKKAFFFLNRNPLSQGTIIATISEYHDWMPHYVFSAEEIRNAVRMLKEANSTTERLTGYYDLNIIPTLKRNFKCPKHLL